MKEVSWQQDDDPNTHFNTEQENAMWLAAFAGFGQFSSLGHGPLILVFRGGA